MRVWKLGGPSGNPGPPEVRLEWQSLGADGGGPWDLGTEKWSWLGRRWVGGSHGPAVSEPHSGAPAASPSTLTASGDSVTFRPQTELSRPLQGPGGWAVVWRGESCLWGSLHEALPSLHKDRCSCCPLCWRHRTEEQERASELESCGPTSLQAPGGLSPTFLYP